MLERFQDKWTRLSGSKTRPNKDLIEKAPRAQNCRFAFKPDCLFSGQLIKRNHKISFRLNAREIKAFRGDTILSALLAAGIASAGQFHDQPIALDPGLCLAVFPVGKAQTPLTALPLERTKAVDGMELVTPANGLISAIGQKYRLGRFAGMLAGNSRHSLNYRLAKHISPLKAWISLKAGEKQSVDLVVVGGGVAGMSAALKAAQKGLRVALIEQRAVLGGDAPFFGSIQGEKRSEDFVSELKADIDQKGGVLVFTSAVALSLAPGKVRVHQVDEKNGFAVTRLIDFATRMTIIAAGSFERLPIFSGNRLPGVCGSRTAFFLAAHYGVWRGQTAAFCTVSSAATRVALLAADLGINITKLADGRANPKSRFFEFAKAYGVLLATGTQVIGAKINADRSLGVQMGLSQNGSNRMLDRIETERLVVCGGWQPNLTLWHMAQGEMKWNSASQQFAGSGTLKNVKLAGACAGVTGMSQCAQSGISAFLELSGQACDPDTTNDHQFLEHESQDGALPVSEPDPDLNTAYLDNAYLDTGFSFAKARQKPKPGFWDALMPSRKDRPAGFDLPEEDLSLNDIAAKVALKEIDAELAEVIAEERCGLASTLAQKTPHSLPSDFAEKNDPGAVPPYLYGRFGAKAKIVGLVSSEIDNFEVGALIYPNTTKAGPDKAIGVIIAVANEVSGQGKALLDPTQLIDPDHAIVRNDTHAIKAMVRNL